jgi:KaiC/GvpD/RAD55 family RecA-like ATPase
MANRRNIVAEARARLHHSNGTNGKKRDETEDLSFVGRPVVVRLSDIAAEKVEWLAPGFLPFGKFMMIEGDPGQGKSNLTLDIAARLTRGQSVLGSPAREPMTVLLVTYEDGLADTIRPRIDALGGDASRVFVFRGVAVAEDDERTPTFPEDTTRVQAIIGEHGARALIVDPIGAALGETTDSHKDASVRRVTARLARLAEETGAVVIGVRHLTKQAATNAIRAGGGSIAFVGAARVVLLVSEHPDDGDKPQHERRRVLACVKNNLSPHPASRLFELVQADGHEHARIHWLGETTLSADDLNAAHAAAAPEERDAAAERADWLREVLSSGPVESKELFKLATAAGHSVRTIRRTAKTIGARMRREGSGAAHRALWEMGTPATPATPACHKNVAGVAGVAGVGSPLDETQAAAIQAMGSGDDEQPSWWDDGRGEVRV